MTTKRPCTNELCKNVYTVIRARYWRFALVAVVVLVVVIIHSCDWGFLKENISLFYLDGTVLTAHTWFVHEEGGRNETVWMSTQCACALIPPPKVVSGAARRAGFGAEVKELEKEAESTCHFRMRELGAAAWPASQGQPFMSRRPRSSSQLDYILVV